MVVVLYEVVEVCCHVLYGAEFVVGNVAYCCHCFVLAAFGIQLVHHTIIKVLKLLVVT
jgi:hypothetical protein